MKVEIADDHKSRQTGLMFRKKLDKNSGMLFVFDHPDHMGFWGKNTYIPLDVAFITEDMKIASIREIVPMSTRIVRCDTPCKYALEVNHDFFAESGVSVGDIVNIDEDDVTFTKKEKSE